MIYLLIFFVKLIEVSLATVRNVLSNKGEKLYACLIASVEITLWLIIASVVLTGLSQDIFKGVAYGVAYVCGLFTGMILEEKMALGLSRIEIIASEEIADEITNHFRSLRYGVTVVPAKGQEGVKNILILMVFRKDLSKTMNILKKYDHIFVSVLEVKKITMGTLNRH